MHIYRNAQYEKKKLLRSRSYKNSNKRVIIHLTLETISQSIFIFFVTMIIGRSNFYRLVFLMYRSTCLILLFGLLPFMLPLLIQFFNDFFQQQKKVLALKVEIFNIVDRKIVFHVKKKRYKSIFFFEKYFFEGSLFIF